MTNFLGLGLLLLLVPPFQMKGLNRVPTPQRQYWTAQSKIMGAFAVMNFVAMLLIFFFVPETAGTVLDPNQGKLNSMSLEELNYVFGERTMRYARYQVEVMLPWLCQKARWILCRVFTNRWHNPDPPIAAWMWVRPEELNENGNVSDRTEVGEAESEKDTGSVVQVEDTDREARLRTSRTAEISLHD